MSISAEMSHPSDLRCLSPYALLEEFRNPACLVADEGQRVLSVNGEATALLERISRSRSIVCDGEGPEFPGSGSFPFFPADLAQLTETLGPPRVWPLSGEEEPCSIYLFPGPGTGKEKRDRKDSLLLSRDKTDEGVGAFPDRFGWNRKTFAELFVRSPVPFLYTEGNSVRRGNPALCSLLGCEEMWLVGQRLDEVFRIPEQEEGEFFEAMEQFSGESPVFGEVKLCKKNGSFVEATVYGIPFTRERGKPAHFFFVQEASERKELERLLLRNSMVVTRSPLVLFQGELGERFFLNYVSENVTQFGYNADEMMNRDFPFYSLIHPDDLDKVPQRGNRDKNDGMDREYLFRMRDPGGEYHWMSLRDRILPGKKGENGQVVGVILDVTDRKEAEIALRESHRETKSQLLQLQAAWEQTIQLLASVTELRDPYTMGHQRRVSHLAGALARKMALGEDQVQEIIRAGLVHDIGKIQIPAEFLSKPGKLAEKEFAIIREHPETGAGLLKSIELPWPLSDIVLQHHERMDGSGYPLGLRDDAILPAARILAVADVVEAMASHRPYRPALGIGKALEEITGNAGRLYDAEVVASCRCLFLEEGYHFPTL